MVFRRFLFLWVVLIGLSGAIFSETAEKITEVLVQGNRYVASAKIQDMLKLSAGDDVDRFLIYRNQKLLENTGLFRSVDVQVLTDGNGKKVVFRVQENPIIRGIEFQGLTLESKETLLQKAQIQEGDVLSIAAVRNAIQTINTYFNELGYVKTGIFDFIPPTDENPNLVFKVQESIIDDVIVTGNTRTKTYVITREMALKPGMALNEKTLVSDLRKVYNLNFFQEVTPAIIPTDQPNRYTLQLNIVEQEHLSTFTFGGAYNATYGFSAFSDVYLNNLFGEAKTVMVRGQFGLGGSSTAPRNTSYQIKYFDPWMFGERKSLQARVWRLTGEISSVNPLSSSRTVVDANKLGGDVTVGLPITYNLKTFHTFKDESVFLPRSRSLSRDEISYTQHTYQFKIAYDTRDVWFNPTKGTYTSLAVEKSFLLTNDSLDFTRYDGSFKYFYPVFKKQVFALRYDVGLLESPDIEDQDIYNNEYYIIGGANTVRGYPETGAQYGNKQSLLSAEYRFLMGRSFQLVGFVDSGLATFDSIGRLSDYIVGKGVGIRYTIPQLGPLRLDMGWDDKGELRTHFSIGHTF